MRKDKKQEIPHGGEILTRPVSLSGRLAAIAGLARSGACVCDVGCDHAHIPIRLLQEGRFDRAIGMDVIEGPLEKAAGNLALYGMEDRVELRLSNGLDACRAGEADTLIVTGMGGTLMEEILLREPDKTASFSALVLGPQSDPDKVRAAIRRLGAQIVEERLVFEDGKYYPVLRAEFPAGDCPAGTGLPPGSAPDRYDGRIPAPDQSDGRIPAPDQSGGRRTGQPSGTCHSLQREKAGNSLSVFAAQVPAGHRQEAADMFGLYLLQRRDPVLQEYLVRQTRVLEMILQSVSRAATERDDLREKHLEKEREIRHRLEVFRAALTCYE